MGGAVPKDFTGDFAGGTKAEQPAQWCRARVEADGHAAKRLELYQLRPGRLRQALSGAIRIGEQQRHGERRADQAARRQPIHQDPGAWLGRGAGTRKALATAATRRAYHHLRHGVAEWYRPTPPHDPGSWSIA